MAFSQQKHVVAQLELANSALIAHALPMIPLPMTMQQIIVSYLLIPTRENLKKLEQKLGKNNTVIEPFLKAVTRDIDPLLSRLLPNFFKENKEHKFIPLVSDEISRIQKLIHDKKKDKFANDQRIKDAKALIDNIVMKINDEPLEEQVELLIAIHNEQWDRPEQRLHLKRVKDELRQKYRIAYDNSRQDEDAFTQKRFMDYIAEIILEKLDGFISHTISNALRETDNPDKVVPTIDKPTEMSTSEVANQIQNQRQTEYQRVVRLSKKLYCISFTLSITGIVMGTVDRDHGDLFYAGLAMALTGLMMISGTARYHLVSGCRLLGDSFMWRASTQREAKEAKADNDLEQGLLQQPEENSTPPSP